MEMESDIIATIRHGDLHEIRRMLNSSHISNYEDCYRSAIDTGSLDIVKCVMERSCFNHSYAVYAIDKGRYDIASWLLNDKGISCIGIICQVSNVNTLEYMYKNNYTISPNATWNAILNDRVDTLIWLLDHKAYVAEDVWILASRYKRYEHMKILHRYGNKKILQASHNTKMKCLYCIEESKEVICDLWQMETDLYDNFIQWLPLEMVEDTLQLF